MPRSVPALFGPVRLPRSPAEVRFLRYLSLLWGARVGAVVLLLYLLHRARLF
ncbi:MAG: hypothetical protein L3K13_03350 [Thermoplasmata archaeon]|nr:hypothetical protein [Thermoplasmata archaeon]